MPQTDGEEWRGISHLGAGGEVLYSAMPHPTTREDDPLGPVQEHLYVLSSSGAETEIPPAPTQPDPTQFGAVTANERWIVWDHSFSTDLVVRPWIMYAHDRATSTATEIYRPPGTKDQPTITPPGSTGPMLTGDRLVWAEARGLDEEARSRVMMCELPRCDNPEVVFDGAGMPAVTDDGVYAIRTARWDGKTGGRGPTTLVHKEFGGDQRVVRTLDLTKGEDVSGLAASGDIVAWTVNARKQDRIVIRIEHDETVLTGPKRNASFFGYPSVGDDLVVWGEASGNPAAGKFGGYAHDLRTDTTYTLGSPGLYQPHVAGRLIQFQEKTGGGTFDIDAVVVQMPE